MATIIVFDLRGPLAHFRRPDTLGTHATYPFITRTALRGLAASILGLPAVPSEVRCGIRLLAPVRTVVQELTMHGKTWVAASGRADSFHRPTAIELVVQPHYRIFYKGPLSDELSRRLKACQSQYHTYLGSAYCLTFPAWVAEHDMAGPLVPEAGQSLRCSSVVPSPAVARLLPDDRAEYARVGGLLWEHIGERRFRGTTSVLYEMHGRPLTFVPAPSAPDDFWEFHTVDEEGTVCLW